MHGRLKVRTSEEEKERKKKEQLLKVKAYRHAMGKIQAKQQRQEYDDEMLQATTLILLRNPDIATLWNIRRECVLLKAKDLTDTASESEPLEQAPELEKDQEEVENTDSTADGDKVDEVTKAYRAELNLTEQCLVVNPKSYCAWHHRCWTLEHSPQPDWEQEMQLCNKYLKFDERNFHTWDYRRYVASKADVTKEKELDYCTDKIKVNFSNYSSWHYRSLLLPQLHPYVGYEALPKRPMDEAKLKEELEMVLTAAFTDPNDSSAWFYQRWLLSCSHPDLDVCAFRCDGQKAVLAFTKPVASDAFGVTIRSSSANDSIRLLEWQPASTSDGTTDTIWLAEFPSEQTLDNVADYELEISIPTVGTRHLSLQKAQPSSFYYFNPPNASMAFSEAVLEELRTQLESCHSLLEFEPDSKWTLHTAALLMHAIDPHEYHEKSLGYLAKLQKVDELRTGYYKDLASKWILEKSLTDCYAAGEIPKRLRLTQHPQLSSIYYEQYFSITDEVSLPPELKETSGRKVKTFGQLHMWAFD